MVNENCCAFSGHREYKGDIDEKLFDELLENLVKGGISCFYCGMAMGFDLVAADAVIRLKKTYPHVELIACVPCPEQEKFYPEEEKEKYRRIIAQCDKTVVLSTHYYRGCMHRRNRYMVDNSSVLVAYDRNGESGGTKYTLEYAASKNLTVYIV